MGKTQKKRRAYAKAGVNIDAANKSVEQIKRHIYATVTSNVLSKVGSFGGLFDVSFLKDYKNPVLVQSIDGVGTKTMIAEMASQWTVGRDVVNHCINDILTCGAQPLTFLDYIGAHWLKPKIIEEIVAEMANACIEAGIPLLSGETAEMPGIYQAGRNDIVGCITGVVERDKIIDGSKITEGDVLLGLRSNGLHTNGFSLARKAFFETRRDIDIDTHIPILGCAVGEELLKVHKSYLPQVTSILKKDEIKIHGIAHITGGGLLDNIERLLPEGLCAEISKRWKIPPIFQLIQQIESVSDEEMRQVFNLGIGMVLIISSTESFSLCGETPIHLGKIKKARYKEQNQKAIFTY